ncbi:MAG: hypothetical protein IPJ98_17950 [Bryobacterales bacterium]|nr:hypothetical protein [Bryobacterales bacterium]
MVLNNYLKIAVASLALVCIGLLVLNVKLFAAFSEVKPLVIRINEVGRAEAIQYSSLEYQPQEAEIGTSSCSSSISTTAASGAPSRRISCAPFSFWMRVLPKPRWT